MNYFISGSINKKLVLLAVLPTLVVILYGGMEQSRTSIEKAKQEIQLLTRTMAEVQNDLTRQTLPDIPTHRPDQQTVRCLAWRADLS